MLDAVKTSNTLLAPHEMRSPCFMGDFCVGEEKRLLTVSRMENCQFVLFYFRPTFVCYLSENVDLSISFACFFVQLLFFEVEGECKMVLINRQVAWSGRTQ